MVEKFLLTNERILHSTDFEVEVNGEPGFFAHVTDRRILLHKREGVIFKKDRLIEVPLKFVTGIDVSDKGFILKKKHITLKTGGRNIYIEGWRGDLQHLYSTLNELLLGPNA